MVSLPDHNPSAPTGPLAGMRILDLTTVLLGPYSTKILGDLGADVIKIEPVEGEGRRYTGPQRNHGMGQTFIVLNRAKLDNEVSGEYEYSQPGGKKRKQR